MRPAFADTVMDSQRTFRAVLDALARPGTVVTLGKGLEPPPPLHRAAAAFALAFLDLETPLWVDVTVGTEARAWLGFHCGVPIVEPATAARFALIADTPRMPALGVFDRGSDERPDRSATVVMQVTALRAGCGRRISGPGITGEARLDVSGLGERFWADLSENHRLFPRGIDLVLTAGVELAALPRTTRVEA